MYFQWDTAKARRNLRKHGVAFEEASTIFRDPISPTVEDPLHSAGEDRFVSMGTSGPGRLLLVVHAEAGERIRIISARGCTARERRSYETGKSG